ncbi:unnamed protein product, partial [Ectocarpus sp. 4 AP-2014]
GGVLQAEPGRLLPGLVRSRVRHARQHGSHGIVLPSIRPRGLLHRGIQHLRQRSKVLHLHGHCDGDKRELDPVLPIFGSILPELHAGAGQNLSL